MQKNLGPLLSNCHSFGAKKALGILAAVVIMMIGGNGLASLLISSFIENGSVVLQKNGDGSGARIALQQLASLIASSSVLYYFLLLNPPEEFRKATLQNIGLVPTTRKWLVFSALSGFLFALVIGHVVGAMFPPSEDFVPNPLMAETQTGNWIQWLTFLMVVCIAPPIEELLFRGILYRGFSESWGKIPAAFVIVILFIVLHNETLAGGYWVSILGLVSISIMLLLARERSGSLLPPILIHSGFNLAIALPI